MTVELIIPSLGESITEVQIGEWLKKVGDRVDVDEPLVEIESAKVTVELPAPSAGVLTHILKETGEDAEVGDVIGRLDEAGDSAVGSDAGPSSGAGDGVGAAAAVISAEEQPVDEAMGAASAPVPGSGSGSTSAEGGAPLPGVEPESAHVLVTPSARRVLYQAGVSPDQVTPTGPGGRLLKGDALQAVGARAPSTSPLLPPSAPAPMAARPSVFGSPPAMASPEAKAPPTAAPPTAAAASPRGLPLAGAVTPPTDPERREWSVRMSPLRRTIAARLVRAQQEAALLTTFNEIDMSQVISMRKRFGETFLKTHDIKLGFMSFFVKATVVALERFPAVNGEIRGQEIVYRSYADVGIAVGGGKGLVVPIIRDAQRKSFAELEREIADYGRRAVANKLQPEELDGGTFTISNGGVYGSLLSTPIPSPPQSGILGLHAIEQRPVVVEGEVVVRPMMYVALSYDHRIVDGKEAVTFLKTIKEQMEQPARMLLEV